MKLGVKLYIDVKDRPDHIPAYWPAEVVEAENESDIPEGYTVMTPDEYAEYRTNNWVETKREIVKALAIATAPKPSFWQRLIRFFRGEK